MSSKQISYPVIFGVFLSFVVLILSIGTNSQLVQANFGSFDFYCASDGNEYNNEVACNEECTVTCVDAGSRSEGSGTGESRSVPGVNRFANDQTPYPHSVTPPAGGPISDVESFLYILTDIIQFAEAIFWILAVGFGLYGAYLYLFAAGNSEKAGQARKVFIYAAIASLLAIVAYGVPGLVQSFVLGY